MIVVTEVHSGAVTLSVFSGTTIAPPGLISEVAPFFPMAIIDLGSRKVLACGLSNHLTAEFSVEALEEAPRKFGKPEIFNTDQYRPHRRLVEHTAPKIAARKQRRPTDTHIATRGQRRRRVLECDNRRRLAYCTPLRFRMLRNKS